MTKKPKNIMFLGFLVPRILIMVTRFVDYKYEIIQ